jgi:outer membrane protein assembly factor BamB
MMKRQPSRVFLFVFGLIMVSAVVSIQAMAQSDEAPAVNSGHMAVQNSETTAATPVPAEQLANRCTATRKLSTKSPAWAGWGANPPNWRYQNAMQAGFSAASVPQLKLKWAFGIPSVKIVRSQPAIYGGRVYVGGNDGTVYSLDASTGCT